MVAGQLHIDRELSPAEALSRGIGGLERVDEACPVVGYGAPLGFASVVLGAYQHAAHALRMEALDALALPIVRRASGGGALWVSPGVVYVAIALQNASSLMACPPGKILNRNVRGLLAGLRSLGVPAFYFGRDFLSAGAPKPAPVAFVGWDERADGRVLLECFVALETSLELPGGLDGYPDRSAAFGGKVPTTLRALHGTPLTPERVLQALFEGCERAYDARFERRELPTLPTQHATQRVDPMEKDDLIWSKPQPEAIGFISAGLRLDHDGRVRAFRLGGDFFQHRTCGERLAERLLGQSLTPEAVGAAVDAVYAARPGLLEGVRSLHSVQAAILDAHARAQAATR